MTHVLFVSYGNDSLALLQWAIENKLQGCVALYSDTGWASSAWPERVRRWEEYAGKNGISTARTESIGMPELIKLKKAWPRNGLQFCTEHLKILPALRWLEKNDPNKNAVCVCGVRREESARRRSWPEWIEESEKHGGRPLWSPLVSVTQAQRDVLIMRAGGEPLPHRSQECFPCINSNRAQLRLLTEGRVEEIERLEAEMGHTAEGKPRTMFRPYRHQGATGIREVWEWAKAERNAQVKMLRNYLRTGSFSGRKKS